MPEHGRGDIGVQSRQGLLGPTTDDGTTQRPWIQAPSASPPLDARRWQTPGSDQNPLHTQSRVTKAIHLCGSCIVSDATFERSGCTLWWSNDRITRERTTPRRPMPLGWGVACADSFKQLKAIHHCGNLCPQPQALASWWSEPRLLGTPSACGSCNSGQITPSWKQTSGRGQA